MINIFKIKQELDRLKKENSLLINFINGNIEEIGSISHSKWLSDIDKKIIKRIMDIKDKNEIIYKYSQKISEQQMIIEKNDKEISLLQKEITERINEKDQLDEDIRLNKQRQENLIISKNDFEKQMKEYEEAKRIIVNKKLEIDSSLEKMMNDLKTIEIKMQAENQEYEFLKNNASLLKNELEKEKNNLSNLTDSIGERTLHYENLINDIKNSEKALYELNSILSDNKKELEILTNEKTNAQKTKTDIAEQYEKLKSLTKDLVILSMAEQDLENGIVYEFAPELFKRFLNIDKERAKRWYVEVLSRDSKEEIEIPAEFDSELELIDNAFVENLFAKKIAYRKSREDNSKENEFIDSYLESYLKAWENYLDSRETRST